MSLDDSLHGFLSRLLGWTNTDAVDQAIRSIELAVGHHAHLVLRGPGDLVPIARALHRRTIGADRPFIVCDPRRRDVPASVRSPANRDSGVVAFEAARGGSLCVRIREATARCLVGAGADTGPGCLCPVHHLRRSLSRRRQHPAHHAGADHLPTPGDAQERGATDRRRVWNRCHQGAGCSPGVLDRRRSRVGRRASSLVLVGDREGDAAARGAQGLGQHEHCRGPARDGAGVAAPVDGTPRDAAGVDRRVGAGHTCGGCRPRSGERRRSAAPSMRHGDHLDAAEAWPDPVEQPVS